jgi:hypothetical protein
MIILAKYVLRIPTTCEKVDNELDGYSSAFDGWLPDQNGRIEDDTFLPSHRSSPSGKWPDCLRHLLHIQIAHIEGVLLDEFAAGFYLVAHEDSEQVVGAAGVLHADLQQGAVGRVEGGFS